jgi:hypothetical protein
MEEKLEARSDDITYVLSPDNRTTIRLPALLAQLVEHLHGKEGVDGSSPSEGLREPAGNGGFSRF